MKQFTFKKIDAFASGLSGGNPAGFVLLENAADITAQEMHLIARQLKGFVTETAFAHYIDGATIGLKYWSSEREVEFCGHATIASMYELIRNDPALMALETVHIVNNKGRLSVENRIREEDSVYIHAPQPVWGSAVPDTESIAKHLKINKAALSPSYPVAAVDAGLNTLLVPIRNLDEILAIKPDLEDLKKFCVDNGLDTVEVFSDEVAHAGHGFRTRVFAPTFGYLEDMATGSGNSALGYYLKKHGFWKTDSLVLEQNGERDECNIVHLRAGTNAEGTLEILFGGPAITRIEGKYILP